MTPDIFNEVSTVATVLPVRDVAASVRCYRDKLGLEPIHVGSDGPDHPITAYAIAGSVVSLWQLPAGPTRVRDDNDRNS
jgi:catechol 2,3-dioxygenase-like lactoylglutathione lyase family enzyme